MREVIAAIAGIIAFCAVIPYVRDTIRGKSKPNIVTWFTWTLLLVIGTSAAFADHEIKTALLSLGNTLGTGLILLLAIKYGTSKFSRLDTFCQIAIVIGLILWFVYDSPEIAVIFVVTIDLIAAIPTFIHSWKRPFEETWQTFFLIAVASLLTILTLTTITISGLLLPIYYLSANAAIAAIILYRRNVMAKFATGV